MKNIFNDNFVNSAIKYTSYSAFGLFLWGTHKEHDSDPNNILEILKKKYPEDSLILKPYNYKKYLDKEYFVRTMSPEEVDNRMSELHFDKRLKEEPYPFTKMYSGVNIETYCGGDAWKKSKFGHVGVVIRTDKDHVGCEGESNTKHIVCQAHGGDAFTGEQRVGAGGMIFNTFNYKNEKCDPKKKVFDDLLRLDKKYSSDDKSKVYPLNEVLLKQSPNVGRIKEDVMPVIFTHARKYLLPFNNFGQFYDVYEAAKKYNKNLIVYHKGDFYKIKKDKAGNGDIKTKETTRSYINNINRGVAFD